ncbi:MAG: hypothetical protein JKY44_06330 [Flavobacteriaceae bacterium]|nr:hypothetical protein [Flavobacteriaceae bacterium]
MKLFRKLLFANTSGKTILALFILTNAVYVCMLTITIPNTMRFSNDYRLLDMMPLGYDLTYVNTLFDALGKIGRETYLTNQIPVDMLYPFLFGLTYSLLLAYLLKKLNKGSTRTIFLCLIPVLAGVADYLENFGIILLIQNYPLLTETAVKTTSFFSVVKSVSTSIYFILLIVILIILGFKSLNKIKTASRTR